MPARQSLTQTIQVQRRHPAVRTKLSPAVVAAIERDRNTPCACCGLLPPTKHVAAKHGVSLTTVSNIANGRKGYKK